MVNQDFSVLYAISLSVSAREKVRLGHSGKKLENALFVFAEKSHLWKNFFQ